MNIRQMSHDDLAAVASLCERELTRDRDARALPGILMRRPHVGLVAAAGPRLLGACFGSAEQAGGESLTGFIDLLVVDRSERRQGIGAGLVTAMQDRLAASGCQVIAVRGHAPHYAWPGIDLRYTAAICMAEDLGYRRAGCEVDMRVDLTRAPLDTRADQERLRQAGIEVRRANASDDGPLQRALAATWIPDWIAALTAALRDDQAGLHLALAGQRYVGFCAYGVNRLHETGPLGTAPDLRGRGIAATLIRRCLADQRDRGLHTADLVWAGPLSYFSRTLNATISRAYWLYEKDLAAPRHLPRWQDRIGLI